MIDRRSSDGNYNFDHQPEENTENDSVYKKIIYGILFACFTFVFTVNTSPRFAVACGRIYLLRELALAVSFSDTLDDAIKNANLQLMNLKDTDNGIIMNIEYLIVNKNKINITYNYESKKYTDLDVDFVLQDGLDNELDENDIKLDNKKIYQLNDEENKNRYQLNIEFLKSKLPLMLNLSCNFYEKSKQAPEKINANKEYVGKFSFKLKYIIF